MSMKHTITDYDNKTWDTGRAIAVFVVLNAVALVWVDVAFHAAKFDVQAYGIGIGGLLTGLAFVIFGDAKGREVVSGLPADPAPVEAKTTRRVK